MNLTIGETIKKLRNQKKVTQEKLAESLGVTPQAISRWESGAGYPAIDYLPDLAAFSGGDEGDRFSARTAHLGHSRSRQSTGLSLCAAPASTPIYHF